LSSSDLAGSAAGLDSPERGQPAFRVYLLALLACAFALRFYGINWDRGLFFHPDERQILMVAAKVSWPASLSEFLSPSSPLNPHFFAYGSVPIYLLRGLSALLGLWKGAWSEMHRYYLLGRLLSALFDTATVLATWSLARKLFGRWTAALSATFVALAVLHIQMAHFYTSDPLLTLLILLAVGKAVDVAARGRGLDGVWLGLLLALALTTKVSVLPLVAVVAVAWLAFGWPVPEAKPAAGRSAALSAGSRARTLVRRLLAAQRAFRMNLRGAWKRAGSGLILSYLVAAVGFVLLQPYALIDARSFAAAVGTEVTMAQGIYDFPYTRQYAGTQPIAYQAAQLLLHGLGPALGALAVAGFVLWVWRAWSRPRRDQWVVLTWPLLYVWMQAWTYAKFMRYMLPLSPFLCIGGAALWVREWQAQRSPGSHEAGSQSPAHRAGFGLAGLLWVLVLLVVLGYTGFYALSYLNVYRQPHTWLQASEWLCQHSPQGTTILAEYWDDPLPAQGADSKCSARITTLIVDFHTLDSEGRTEELVDALMRSDYVVLSTQRLYAPLTRQPWFFPRAARYYQALFAERLGFDLVAAPAVYPQLAGVTFLDNPRQGLVLPTPPLLEAVRPAGLVLDLGYADESFTVYDHPQPLIFARTASLTREQLLILLDPANP